MFKNEDEVRAATKLQIAEALSEAGVSFKAKERKGELAQLLISTLRKGKREPSVAQRLCQLFSKVGTTITEDELRAAFPIVSFDGTVRPWISSLKNRAYLPAGIQAPLEIRRSKLEDDVIVYERVT